jgi:tetratricopeptide (TPR) repeat protein
MDHPADPAGLPPPSGSGDALRRAAALIDLRRYPQALEALAPLIAGNGDARALCQATRALLGLGRYDEAVATAGRAVAADPGSEWAQRLRSSALLAAASGRGEGERMRLTDEAAQAARQAVRLAPNLPVTYRAAVSAELAAGDHPAAEAAFACLLALAPEDAETWITASLIALDSRNPAMAEDHARRAVALDPVSPEAWNNLGVALQRQGRLKDAVGAYRQSARLDPSQGLSRRNLSRSGIALLRLVLVLALLPVLFAPYGLAVYLGLMIGGYHLFRPGAPGRGRAESLGLRAALRFERSSIRSTRFQLILSDTAGRGVTIAAAIACFEASKSTPPLVVGVCALAVLVTALEQHFRLLRSGSGRRSGRRGGPPGR